MTARAKSESAPPVFRRGIGKPTKCRSCGVDIEFAHTTTGKVAPFEKDDDGLYVFENGVARLAGGANPRQLELGEQLEQRYTSHFARCPQAKNWRGRTDP